MAKRNDKYSIQIYWWADEKCWYACAPEFPGISGLGASREEALVEISEAINEILDDRNLKLPDPWILKTNDPSLPLYEKP